ncbi:hypothetical protein [uncultured Methylobacterium sp.]|uniref:hypothetical protein n=1 Tax=uncultured Methylobacterium sp. TaxID=157278 RepID=UPI0035CBFDAB
MAAKLTALGGTPYQPPVYRCCRCRAYACRGYPNDVWYCGPCVPPGLRFPWEAGYAAPEPEPALPVPGAAPPAQAALDLLPGSAPV